MSTQTIAAPERDGRCFVETPAEVKEAYRVFLTADLAWKAGLGQDDLALAARTRLYEDAQEAERELIRAMEAAQGRRARMAGYYEVPGPTWVGFDKIGPDGLTLVFKYAKPVFAKQK